MNRPRALTFDRWPEISMPSILALERPRFALSNRRHRQTKPIQRRLARLRTWADERCAKADYLAHLFARYLAHPCPLQLLPGEVAIYNL